MAMNADIVGSNSAAAEVPVLPTVVPLGKAETETETEPEPTAEAEADVDAKEVKLLEPAATAAHSYLTTQRSCPDTFHTRLVADSHCQCCRHHSA